MTVDEGEETSALGERCDATPLVLPIRGKLDAVKRFLKVDLYIYVYICRGSRQRSLQKSRYCNNYKVAEYGRDVAIAKFRDMLLQEKSLHKSLWTLSGRRLICHCRPSERCHGDVFIEQFREGFSNAYDRTVGGEIPQEPRVLSCMAKLRAEPEVTKGLAPDDDVPGKLAGHRGRGDPMKVGVGYTLRELCDGQPPASLGRWAPGSRQNPSSAHWNNVSERYRRFADHYGTGQLLVSLAMGKVDTCPIPRIEVDKLKHEIILSALEYGYSLERKPGDRADVPKDFRFLQLLLQLSGDSEVGIGEYSQGVRVGLGGASQRSMTPTITWRMWLSRVPYGVKTTALWRPSRLKSWRLCTIQRPRQR